MRQFAIILTFFTLTFSIRILACDCDSQGEFLKVAPKTKLVALIKVSRYLTFKNIYDNPTPMSMEVEVIEVYKGQETRKTFTVWGDNGALCRPYLSRFAIDKYYVIAFDAGSDQDEINANKAEKKTDYSISICGDYWLTVDINKQIATGSVTSGQSQISLADLKNKLWTE
jgi:hypothetical protein